MGYKARGPETFDLTQVDGIKVESREPAKIELYNPQSGKKQPQPLDGVDELLLTDGRIVYQCVQRPNGCGQTWDSPRSVMSHLKVHVGRAAVKRAMDRADELEAALTEAQRQVTSLEGMKQRRDEKIKELTAELKRVRAEMSAEVARLMAEQSSAHPNGSEPVDRDQWQQAVTILDKRADELVREMRGLFADVGGLLVNASPPDEEVLVKARRYDELRNLLGE